ncbi:UNVERIFIED_CONTAM: hypothetical protein FKN15_014221 [Acipenser sinensis]
MRYRIERTFSSGLKSILLTYSVTQLIIGGVLLYLLNKERRSFSTYNALSSGLKSILLTYSVTQLIIGGVLLYLLIKERRSFSTYNVSEAGLPCRKLTYSTGELPVFSDTALESSLRSQIQHWRAPCVRRYSTGELPVFSDTALESSLRSQIQHWRAPRVLRYSTGSQLAPIQHWRAPCVLRYSTGEPPVFSDTALESPLCSQIQHWRAPCVLRYSTGEPPVFSDTALESSLRSQIQHRLPARPSVPENQTGVVIQLLNIMVQSEKSSAASGSTPNPSILLALRLASYHDTATERAMLGRLQADAVKRVQEDSKNLPLTNYYQVNIVHPSQLYGEFENILEEKVTAANVQASFIVPRDVGNERDSEQSDIYEDWIQSMTPIYDSIYQETESFSDEFASLMFRLKNVHKRALRKKREGGAKHQPITS